jgi:hypothetical protein
VALSPEEAANPDVEQKRLAARFIVGALVADVVSADVSNAPSKDVEAAKAAASATIQKMTIDLNQKGRRDVVMDFMGMSASLLGQSPSATLAIQDGIDAGLKNSKTGAPGDPSDIRPLLESTLNATTVDQLRRVASVLAHSKDTTTQDMRPVLAQMKNLLTDMLDKAKQDLNAQPSEAATSKVKVLEDKLSVIQKAGAASASPEVPEDPKAASPKDDPPSAVSAASFGGRS